MFLTPVLPQGFLGSYLKQGEIPPIHLNYRQSKDLEMPNQVPRWKANTPLKQCTETVLLNGVTTTVYKFLNSAEAQEFINANNVSHKIAYLLRHCILPGIDPQQQWMVDTLTTDMLPGGWIKLSNLVTLLRTKYQKFTYQSIDTTSVLTTLMLEEEVQRDRRSKHPSRFEIKKVPQVGGADIFYVRARQGHSGKVVDKEIYEDLDFPTEAEKVCVYSEESDKIDISTYRNQNGRRLVPEFGYHYGRLNSLDAIMRYGLMSAKDVAEERRKKALERGTSFEADDRNAREHIYLALSPHGVERVNPSFTSSIYGTVLSMVLPSLAAVRMPS